jgi:hypothetical protein
MIEILEDPQCAFPGPAGRLPMAGGLLRVTEPEQHGGLVEAVAGPRRMITPVR